MTFDFDLPSPAARPTRPDGIAGRRTPQPRTGSGDPASEAVARPRVEIRRSARRTRTVSAYRRGETIVVLVPAHLSADEERRWVATMVAKVEGVARRRTTDAALEARAADLAIRYLGGAVRVSSVRWVTNQRKRWGSCTPATGAIRISDQVRDMPAYVLDYVLVHELSHLLVPGHGPDFWALVGRYQHAERARGFLEGVSATANLGIGEAYDEGVIGEAYDEGVAREAYDEGVVGEAYDDGVVGATSD